MKMWTRLLQAIGLGRPCCTQQKIAPCSKPRSAESADGDKGSNEQTEPTSEARLHEVNQAEETAQR